MKNKEDAYFKEGFQTLRQILHALGHTCNLKNLETKQPGVPRVEPPDANEKVRFFKKIRVINEEEARFLRKNFNTYGKICAFWHKIKES